MLVKFRSVFVALRKKYFLIYNEFVYFLIAKRDNLLSKKELFVLAFFNKNGLFLNIAIYYLLKVWSGVNKWKKLYR